MNIFPILIDNITKISYFAGPKMDDHMERLDVMAGDSAIIEQFIDLLI